MKAREKGRVRVREKKGLLCCVRDRRRTYERVSELAKGKCV